MIQNILSFSDSNIIVATKKCRDYIFVHNVNVLHLHTASHTIYSSYTNTPSSVFVITIVYDDDTLNKEKL